MREIHGLVAKEDGRGWVVTYSCLLPQQLMEGTD